MTPPPILHPQSHAELREIAIADTVAWLEKAVIGLNLCPFAKGVHAKGQIHYAVSEAVDAEGVAHELHRELEALAEANAELVEQIGERMRDMLWAAIIPSIDIENDSTGDLIGAAVGHYVDLVDQHPNVVRFLLQGRFADQSAAASHRDEPDGGLVGGADLFQNLVVDFLRVVVDIFDVLGRCARCRANDHAAVRCAEHRARFHKRIDVAKEHRYRDANADASISADTEGARDHIRVDGIAREYGNIPALCRDNRARANHSGGGVA